jgi:hypothetical protein
MLNKYLALFFILGLLFFPPRIFAGEAEIQMTQWIRYTHAYQKDTTKTTLTKSEFSLERGYLRLNYKYNDNWRIYFTSDIYTSSKFPEVAGLKIKDAYLRVANFLLPDLDLNIGLQKTYFSRIHDWEYLTVEKAYTDKNKIVASADYGISLTGILPKAFGQYRFGLYNGEGYNKLPVNTTPSLLGDLRIVPFSGLVIGGSVLYEKENRIRFKYSPKPPADTLSKNSFGLAPFARLTFGDLRLEGEYILYRFDRVHHDTTGGTLVEKKRRYELGGFYLMPILIIRPIKAELLGRFDLFQQKEDGKKNEKISSWLAVAGVNYYPFGKDVVFQFNWQRERYLDKNLPGTDIFYFQVKGTWKKLFSE